MSDTSTRWGESSKNTLKVIVIVLAIALVTYLLTLFFTNLITPEHEKGGYEHYNFELTTKDNIDGHEVENTLTKCIAFKSDKYKLEEIQSKFLLMNSVDSKTSLDDLWAMKGETQEESLKRSSELNKTNPKTLHSTKVNTCDSVLADDYAIDNTIVYD